MDIAPTANDLPWLLPEVVLPKQWADQYRSHYRTGEQRLVLEVLVDAVEWATNMPDHLSIGESRRISLRAEARAWIEQQDDHPFSFVWCCQVLDMDPDIVRVGVLRAGLGRVRVNQRMGQIR